MGGDEVKLGHGISFLAIVLGLLFYVGPSNGSIDKVDRAPLERLEQNCLDEDYRSLTCEPTKALGAYYQNTETWGQRTRHIAARIFIESLFFNFPGHGGLEFIEEVHLAINRVADSQDLNICQKVVLATCAVNQIIDYDDSLNDPKNFWQRLQVGLMTPQRFYLDPDAKGICTEFCSLYAHVARSLGLKVQELANGLHCFNRVRNGGEWLYVEPQEGGRNHPYYFRSHKFYLLDIH